MTDTTMIIDLGAYRHLSAIRTDDPYISQDDRWSATTWHLDGHLPGYAKATISWDYDAPAGMIDVFKVVAADLFLGEHPRYAHRTGNLFGQSMKYLAAFMLAEGIDDLGELDEDAFERFRGRLENIIARPSENAEIFLSAMRDMKPGHDSDGEELDGEGQEGASYEDTDEQAAEYGFEAGAVLEDPDDDPLTFAIAMTRLYSWQYLHAARATLARFDLGATFYPFASVSLRFLAQDTAKKGLDDVEPLPDEVSIPILNAAARLIDRPADDVIELQRRFIATRADQALGSKSRVVALRTLVEGFRFGKVGKGPVWRGPVEVAAAGGTGALETRRLVRRIHMAALTILLAGTGLRISEICSLEVDDREIDDELPSCITTRPSLSQNSEHFILHGLLSKNQSKPRPEEWLLSARPMKAHAEPATVRAVRVLERLYQPWRRLTEDPKLRKQLQVSLFGAGLPVQPKAIRWIRGNTLRYLIRDFYASVNLKELLRDAVKKNPALAVYAESNGRVIHHHQWRHTYYEFMVALDDRLLPAVSLHFKHTTLAATEIGYGSKESAVRKAKDAILVKKTTSFFTQRRFGKSTPVGNMAKELDREKAALAEIVGDLPGAEAESRTKQFVLENDLRIWPAEHGSCLFAMNPNDARCRTVNGTVDFRAGAPDLATRTPWLCCGCANFSIGSENIPYWRRRYIENRTTWIESGRNPLFRVSLRRAEQAATILRKMGEEIPVIRPKKPRKDI